MLCGFSRVDDFQRAHREWVEAALTEGAMARDDRWSESIAVGSESFVNRVKNNLGVKARFRQVAEGNEAYTLREPRQSYRGHFDRENEALSANNTVPWEANSEITEA